MPSGVYKRNKPGVKYGTTGLHFFHTEATKEKMRHAHAGEKNYLWKGENVSYRGLHTWVNLWLGKAKKCEHCGIVGNGRQIHWANKDGGYKRNLNDWIQLCYKCHGIYDKANKLRLHKK